MTVASEVAVQEARSIFLTPGTNISILARKMAEED
jgi:hypothetical protein